jgi:hypothetical protein
MVSKLMPAGKSGLEHPAAEFVFLDQTAVNSLAPPFTSWCEDWLLAPRGL